LLELKIIKIGPRSKIDDEFPTNSLIVYIEKCVNSLFSTVYYG